MFDGGKPGPYQGKEVVMHSFREYLALRNWTRHSVVLIVAGLVYIFIGIAYFSIPLTADRRFALVVALNVMPIQAWGGVFVFTGCLSILSSRWPQFVELWGYMALSSLSAAWAAVYALGVLFKHTSPSNLSTVLLWSLIGFLWWAISGLRNPPSRVANRYGPD